MYFRMLQEPDSGAMTYLLADLSSREAVLIDPRGSDVTVLLAMLGEYNLHPSWILRTHPRDDDSPGRELQVLSLLQAPQVVRDLTSAATLTFGHEIVQAIPTPGHAQGCLSFLWRDRLFCGCLLDMDTCRHRCRPALPHALWDSVHEKVFTLPAETLLFSGQACRGRAVSTVLEQRSCHPWFARCTRDEFLARVRDLPEPRRATAGHGRRRRPWSAVEELGHATEGVPDHTAAVA